ADVVKSCLPDGAVKEIPKGVTTEEIAASISPGLKKKAVAGKLNDEMIDLVTPIEEYGAVSIITLDYEDGLYILRHST
ncbi:TGS domain-containing protein, partial [Bacillus paralicheniformis]|uniref:TGS domain-containing protein n=1 Tax=Bacillus paralicheniformis TaxID=1648923 RepID=UPI0020BDDB8B